MTDPSDDTAGAIIEVQDGIVHLTKINEYVPGEVKKKKSRSAFSRFCLPFARCCESRKTDVSIVNHLDHKQETLEAYVMKSVSVDQLESWLEKKVETYRKKTRETHDASIITQGESSTEFFQNLEKQLQQQNIDEHSTVLIFARYIQRAVATDAFRIFKIVSDDSDSSVNCFVMDSLNLLTGGKFVNTDDDIVALVRNVANTQKSIRLSKNTDLAFPKIPTNSLREFGLENEDANYLLYQPLLNSGNTIYVIEMWRIREAYDDKDVQICANIVAALHYIKLFSMKQKESNMSDLLLNVVQAIFRKMVSLDELIKNILKSAQLLVNAERASLFLIDNDNSELVSTVFDLKFDHGQERNLTQPIRMSINQGIAGHVALTGETLNITDAYADKRFNSEVDKATKYKTKSILCMPIKVREKIIGVVEMVNKINNFDFNREDEVAFEKFSIFFGLALYNAKLYDKIKRNEQRFKVALEMLCYHNTCKDQEVKEVQETQNDNWTTFNDFYLDPYEFDHLQKCKAVITMFDDLFGLSSFDSMTVTKFILTVKKNYRTVPYHNFDHGWSVAHAMYVILKNDHEQRFNYNMKLALFVACLCHDLDHRGYNNKYLKDTKSPLAAMYTSSALEHHHFSITVTILQQDGLNIFSKLSSNDYKEILQYMKQCILATDLSAFPNNLSKLNKIVNQNSENQSFNWDIPSNRSLVMDLSMTAADLSASAKPWDIQNKTVKVIFEEFYGQGDKEREAGQTPMPMMDRNKPKQQCVSQVEFFDHICIPCFSMLYKIFPNTKPMYDMALKNFDRWQSMCR
ncbi:probable 3',5'-cyclic phosphodiesterase pde-5 isoform X2 [Bicyclus anynana]|uniref:Phosphodiesterase n=1 Tax=Bicyclus anynana TaxID=110368 RepID=A0ABM3M6Q9_BICAN|nr:probable 3',5'-cyclic phosphodiesterase pde-5 isoform X2 [Bicyclus anynana]